MDTILERVREDIRLRGLSKNTEEEYLKRIQAFLRWAGKPAEEMDEKDIREFLKYLIEKKLSASCVNTHNSALPKALAGS